MFYEKEYKRMCIACQEEIKDLYISERFSFKKQGLCEKCAYSFLHKSPDTVGICFFEIAGYDNKRCSENIIFTHNSRVEWFTTPIGICKEHVKKAVIYFAEQLKEQKKKVAEVKPVYIQKSLF